MSYQVPLYISKDKIFIVNRSEIEGRLDPNPYHNERKDAIKRIKNTGKYLPLSSVVSFKKSITTGIKSGDIYVGLENIISDIGEYVETTEKQSISSAATFENGDILFPKLRPYLNKVFYATFDGLCSTEFHVLKSNGVNSQYLSIFLRSSLVVNQTKHLMTGNTLPRLQTEDVRSLLIPIPSADIQKKIVDCYIYANNCRLQKEDEAKVLLRNIDTYLLDELGIKLPESKNDLTDRVFYTSFNNLVGKRLDPKKYSLQVQQLFDCINAARFETRALKSYVRDSCSGDWGIEDSDSIPDGFTRCLTLRATEIDNQYNLNIDLSKAKYRLIKDERLKKMNMSENDIIIEKSGGSDDQPVGRVAIIEKELLNSDNIAFSNFLMKIKVNEINPDYLYCFLKTMYNIGVTDSMQSQTNGIRNLILDEFLSQTIVVPPKEKQTEIANHVYELRQKAKTLQEEGKRILELAKQEVEHMIINERNRQ